MTVYVHIYMWLLLFELHFLFLIFFSVNLSNVLRIRYLIFWLLSFSPCSFYIVSESKCNVLWCCSVWSYVVHFFLNECKVGQKEHQRFQASYATILKARMTALKKRERKDRRKTADSSEKKQKKVPKKWLMSLIHVLRKSKHLMFLIFLSCLILIFEFLVLQ